MTRDENTRSSYHVDLELIDRSRERFEIWLPLRKVSDCDLGKVSFSTPSRGCVRLHMHVVGCVCAWNFETEFFLRIGECKTRENSNFLKKGKIVISVKKSKIFIDLG